MQIFIVCTVLAAALAYLILRMRRSLKGKGGCGCGCSGCSSGRISSCPSCGSQKKQVCRGNSLL